MTTPIPLVPRDPNDPDRILEPMSHQLAFERSGARNTFLAGGWGSAKTTAGLRWIARAMVANPGLPGIICQPTYSILKEFVESDFIPAFFPYIEKVTNGGRLIKMIDGTRIIGLSYDRLDLFEKHTAAWLYGDEAALAKSLFFTKATARVRHPKAKHLRLGFTGTPHYGWMKDEFEGRDDAQRRIIHAKTTDNKYLPPEYVENLIANCPARMADAYINGRFVPPGGGVFPEWQESVHVQSWPYDVRLGAIPIIDWSPRTPHVLWAQMIPAGYPVPWPDFGHCTFSPLDPRHEFAAAVIVDELVPDGTHQAYTIEKLCREINKRGLPKPAGHNEFCCDPAGLATEATSGIDSIRLATELMGCPAKYKTRPAERSIQYGVDLVKRALEPTDGLPRLFVAKEVSDRAASLPQHLRARSVVNAIPGLSYAEVQDGKAIDHRPVKDGVTDHATDCIRYLLINYFPASRLMIRQVA